LITVIAGGYPVTAVSCNGQERYAKPAAGAGLLDPRERPVQVAVSNPSGIFA
jgi:hypothetical protein